MTYFLPNNFHLNSNPSIPANIRIIESKSVNEINPIITLNQKELESENFERRSLALLEQVAAQDLEKLDLWWRRINLGDPHKYLLPVILSRLSLREKYNPQPIWQTLLNLDRDQPHLYHFRSIYDVRLFFLFRDSLPPPVEASYQKMLTRPHIMKWMAQGTENHMYMQRLSGLALMDGSGFSNSLPAIAATNEAWFRSEINKLLTIGQGEFHSSTYYGYAIGGLLNLYDFAKTPELKQLAKGALDWYTANMAIRLSWGTAGGAESRGFDRGTWNGSSLSALAWLWWGDKPETAENIPNSFSNVAILAALSDYRPPQEFKALANKNIPLPFTLKASHPGYYSYHQSNRFWETFHVTSDYSLGTLLVPYRSYQKVGTINAQYATYKLVIRDFQGLKNAVISLGGIYHKPMATGASPGDQYLQEKGTVIYQLRLNNQDITAGVPPQSHLVLPKEYGQPQKYKNWYIWEIENTWFLAHPWGDFIELQSLIHKNSKEYQVLAAKGKNTAWITEVVSKKQYPDFNTLKKALNQTKIDDQLWETKGIIHYNNITGDRLKMTYNSNSGIADASINEQKRTLENWAVLHSPYLNQDLYSGILELNYPGAKWSLKSTLKGLEWE